MGATLLVGVYVAQTTYMAAQCNAPLRSGKRAERICIYILYGVYMQ